MKEYKKPLPKPKPWTKEFWEGCKRRELLIQQCSDCGEKICYPKMFCPGCGSSNLKWVKSTGRGKIYTYSVIYESPPSSFANDTPYIVAIIELDKGVRMMSNIVGCKPEEVKIDAQVEVVFEDVTDNITLPKFKLTGKET